MSFILAVLMLFSKVGGGEFFKNAVNESFEQNFQNSKAEFNKARIDYCIDNVAQSLKSWHNPMLYGSKFIQKELSGFSKETLKLKAKELLKRVDEFIEESDKKGISPENMHEYIVKYLNETAGVFKPLNREEFDLYCNNPNVTRVYRGLKRKQYVDDFLNGKFSVAKDLFALFNLNKHGVAYGTGIYTTDRLDTADMFSKTMGENKNIEAEWMSKNDSGIIQMAIDKTKIKTISEIVLDEILSFLVESYILKLIGSNITEDFKSYSEYHMKECFLPAFRETFGVDFEEITNKFCLNNDVKDENFREKAFSFLGKLYPFVVDNIYENKNFAQNFSKLMKNNEITPYISKYSEVFRNLSLLAKLLGYDCVKVCVGSIENYYVILNMDNVAVCINKELTNPFKSIEELYNYTDKLHN